MVISVVEQLLPLLLGKGKGTTLARGSVLHGMLAPTYYSTAIPQLDQKLKKRGIPGVFLDLEPHLKGGGQFGGFSGPDGMGVALRGLCRVLDHVEIGYHLRDLDDIRAERGF